MIDIDINIKENTFLVDKSKVTCLINSILSFFQLISCELSVSIVDNKTIKDFNYKFRNKNEVTDVLSFPQVEWEKPLLIRKKHSNLISHFYGDIIVLGDIVISLEQTKVNALGVNQGIDREFCFLLVHSILHLLGHNHEVSSEEAVMIDQQKKIMTLLESNNQSLWKNCIKEAI